MTSVETKMDFDYSVGTEDRFALRKWFAEFTKVQNDRNAETILTYLDEQVKVEGLGEGEFGFEACKEFVKKVCADEQPLVMAYPDAKVKFQHVLFSFQGSFQGYYDGVLAYDGTFDMKVAKVEENFRIVLVKFYPRLIMKQ